MNASYSPLVVWIILAPLCGALLNGILGRWLPKRLVGFIASLAIGASFLLGVVASAPVFGAGGMAKVVQELYTWIAVPGLTVKASFVIDPLSAIMLLVVSGVGFLIHVYSIGYMHDDASYARYFAYLNLFVFNMLLLVLADSLPLMFVGWEGVGLCSYLLIGFWFEDPAKAAAGKKAFVVNRIGDLGFLLGMFTLFGAAATLSFDGLHAAVAGGQITGGVATVAALLLFVGATGKSAQLPLYVWLPDAMAGPTPVSALIHAATMVTAGVYMVARLSFLFAIAPVAGATVATVGALTALFAATIGIAQTDIKKVLAYSTVSQLGYMFIGVGVGAYSAGVFHLMTHAFFKACLFLGSGAVIHAMGGEQNILKMGQLRTKLPYTYWTFLIATLAIAGFPPLAGFFSKDEILFRALSSASLAPGAGFVHPFAYICGLAAAAITSFYMFRLLFLTFLGKSRVDPQLHIHHEIRIMSWPLVILAALAAASGWLGASLFGIDLFGHFLEPVVGHASEIAVAHGSLEHSALAEWTAAALSVAVALSGLALAWLMYLKKPALPGAVAQKLGPLYRLVWNKYGVDEFYAWAVVRPLHLVCRLLWRYVDEKAIDGVAVEGSAHLIAASGALVRRAQTGVVQHYALWIFIGLALLFGYFAYGPW